jgi:ADP-heptose:LPS heptosyltransferase
MQVTPSPQQVRRRPLETRTPGDPFPDVHHLVVARRDRVGDFVLTLPALAALREAYPESVLAVLVDRAVAPLARCVPGLDEVWEAPEDPGTLRRRLLDSGTALLVSISRDAGTAWAAWRAGVRHRVGTARRAYSSLFTRCLDESRRGGALHEVEYALSFAHRCGSPAGPARFPLCVPPAAVESTDHFRRRHGLGETFVVVHPGSGGSCPRWPRRHYRDLVAALRQDGLDVVVSVGPGEPGLTATGGGASPVTFEGNLPALAALVERAALVVGSSTGPLHLAAALGTPTLALHAPWRSCGVGRFGPYAANGWGIVAAHPEAQAWSAARRKRQGPELMAAIPPATVRRAVHALLAGGGL